MCDIVSLKCQGFVTLEKTFMMNHKMHLAPMCHVGRDEPTFTLIEIYAGWTSNVFLWVCNILYHHCGCNHCLPEQCAVEHRQSGRFTKRIWFFQLCLDLLQRPLNYADNYSTSTDSMVFYFSAFLTHVAFLRLAQNWPRLSLAIAKEEVKKTCQQRKSQSLSVRFGIYSFLTLFFALSTYLLVSPLSVLKIHLISNLAFLYHNVNVLQLSISWVLYLILPWFICVIGTTHLITNSTGVHFRKYFLTRIMPYGKGPYYRWDNIHCELINVTK